VPDIHRKFAKWLCENFSVVLLPKFETQGMILPLLDGGHPSKKKKKRIILSLIEGRGNEFVSFSLVALFVFSFLKQKIN